MSDCKVFLKALQDPGFESTGVFGPTSFKQYLILNELKVRARTAELISIDSFDRLPKYLRERDTMVLRLGRRLGEAGTNFALVRVPGELRESFFLVDEHVFPEEIHAFSPRMYEKALAPFRLLGTLTEGSATLLAFASGLIRDALELDEDSSHILPARGNSVYSFEFQAHPRVRTIFQHFKGQIEVDQLFIAERRGIQTVFVIESKWGGQHRTLAKHKLVYPLLALREKTLGMPIVPIYMRIEQVRRELIYRIAECEFHCTNPACLSSLKVSRSGVYRLNMPD